MALKELFVFKNWNLTTICKYSAGDSSVSFLWFVLLRKYYEWSAAPNGVIEMADAKHPRTSGMKFATTDTSSAIFKQHSTLKKI